MTDGAPKAVDGSFSGLSEHGFQLREGVLDRIEVRTVGREIEQAGAGRLDGLADLPTLMAGEIVHDDDVTGREFRDEHLIDIGLEGVAVDGAVEDHGRDDAGQPKTGHEGRRLPVAVGDRGAKPLALRCPAALTRHVRRSPGLVDEDEALGIEARLCIAPVLPLLQDVGVVLLGCMRRLFLSVTAWRSKKRHNVPMPKESPCSASFA